MSQNSKITWTQPCNLCSSNNISVLSNVNRSGKPLQSVICQDCGLVWTDPLPHNPRSFYENDYRVAYKGTFTPKPKHILRAGKVALSRKNMLDQYISQQRKILDVGTGGGEFAYLLKTLGHEVNGIEPNKGYAEYSKQEYGLSVQNGFIQDIQQDGDLYDLITIWHVLEHTENPTAVIEKLYNLLQPEGVLVVEVPTIEATCQSPKSTFHDAHIFNFNQDTLRKLGEKIGFTELEHKVSADGANITLFFRKHAVKEATANQNKKLAIPHNAERIIGIVKNHTPIKHYLTLWPYKRFIFRMSKSVSEKIGTIGFISGKQLLDKLYQ